MAFGLDEVRFVVAGDPWMKRGTSPAETRLEMTQLAVEGAPGFEVDPRETRRGGATYTADTLEELAAEEPDVAWFFLAGADAAVDLPRWHRGEDVVRMATFVALSRPGHDLEGGHPIFSRIEQLSVPAIDISSTDLRRRFAEGAAVRYQLPLAVEHYVRQRGLYGASRHA